MIEGMATITSLGTCDCAWYADESSVYGNKLGGKPNWLIQNTGQSVNCAECQGQVIFVGQMYCPVESPPLVDRVLYIFFCPTKNCIKTHKSWMVIRCQADSVIVEEKKVEVKSAFDVDLDSMDWGEEPFEEMPVTSSGNQKTEDVGNNCHDNHNGERATMTESVESVKSEPLEKEFSTRLNLASELSKDDCRKSPTVLSPFQSVYVYFNDENEFSVEEVFSVEERLKAYLESENMTLEELEGVKKSKKSTGNEEIEKDISLKDMPSLQGKFFKVLKKCPNQVVRYSYNGQPLQYNPLCNLKVPSCSCGSSRVYEFQIMPAVRTSLVSKIELSEDALEGLDIGSVYVYTCSSNCWTQNSDLLKREFVVTQYDDTAQENVTLRRGGGRYKL